MYAANKIKDCYVKLEKLKIETIMLAQYGIKECFVRIDRNDINEYNRTKERCNAPKKLILHLGSVRSHCKWLPTKKSVRNTMKIVCH